MGMNWFKAGLLAWVVKWGGGEYSEGVAVVKGVGSW